MVLLENYKPEKFWHGIKENIILEKLENHTFPFYL